MSYTKNKALEFTVDTRITKSSYNKTKLGAKQRGTIIYSYYDTHSFVERKTLPSSHRLTKLLIDNLCCYKFTVL